MELPVDIKLVTYGIYIACGVVWILSILRCLSHRRLAAHVDKTRSMPSTDKPLPGISVIVTAHDQCDELRRNLPLILNQIYPNFEVLVVDMNSQDGTEKLLEKMEEEYHNLRHTFTPATGRDISTQRLAITLGVKASTYPWFALTQADCTPISHQWLRRMGESIANHRAAEMAIGYTRYPQPRNYTERRQNFHHLWQEMHVLRYAPKHGAYRNEGTNLVYKKELFLSHQGFASHANLLMGATDIMINQNSTMNNTAVCLHPEAIMQQDIPVRKKWIQDRLYFEETKRHFTHKWFFRLRYYGSIILHALLVTLLLSSLVLAILQQEYVVAGIVIILSLLHTALQGIMLNATSKALNDRYINHVQTAWFIHLLPFWHLRILMQYIFGNKQKYRKKYI